jgi:hypothetical protein
MACGFYAFLKVFHYEAVNPGQDFGEWEVQMGPGSWNGELDRPSCAITEPDTPNRTHVGPQNEHANAGNASPDGNLRTKENTAEMV